MENDKRRVYDNSWINQHLQRVGKPILNYESKEKCECIDERHSTIEQKGDGECAYYCWICKCFR